MKKEITYYYLMGLKTCECKNCSKEVKTVTVTHSRKKKKAMWVISTDIEATVG